MSNLIEVLAWKFPGRDISVNGSTVVQWPGDLPAANAANIAQWNADFVTAGVSKTIAKAAIDTAAGVVRKKYAADWLVDKEYDMALADANAYKTAGYTGTVPATVQSWATASGNTATWAANNIIATAAGLNAKLVSIRDARLNGKAAVDAATTQAGIDSAVATYSATLAAL